MKILLAISNLSAKGGAQKVVFQTAEFLKKQGHEATILTGVYDKEKTFEEFADLVVIPLVKHYRHFVWNQMILSRKFTTYNTKAYDVIIAYDFPSNLLAMNHQKVIFACNTPFRLFYDLKQTYLDKYSFPIKQVLGRYISYMTKKDQAAVQKVNKIITISKNVQKRIQHYYNKEAELIYLGIEQKNGPFTYKGKLLCISRLYPEKRVDVALRAMKQLPGYQLVIVGDGSEEQNLKKLKEELGLINIQFLKNLSEQELKQLYRECFCTIYLPKDEDFGLIPIESNSFGKMCIGINEGGLPETIIHKETGYLIEKPESSQVVEAVKWIEQEHPETHKEACLGQANNFSLDRYQQQLLERITQL